MGVIWGEVKILFKILCVVYISFRQRKRGKVYFTVSMIYKYWETFNQELFYSPGHSLYDIKNTNVNMVF